MVSLGVLFGLFAMIGWGMGNFLETIPIRKIGSLKVMYFTHLVNLIVFTPIFIFLLYNGTIHMNFKLLIMLIGFTVLQVAGIYFIMKGIEIGEVALVTPISSSSTIITVTLSIIFFSVNYEEVVNLFC